VSRKHAELRPSGASWTVRDLGSTNGVKVNGRRIQGAQSLRSGDTITLGTSDIVFELE
jgi:pSer/pThr/pTyr-binding forkhead associated (FHA) protein